MVVTRFAPSPTGFLHIGGARTALYCWLWAKAQNGKFILRIEDTDLERSTQEAVDAILEGMKWLGLEHDEGPFYQTKRFDRYHEVIEQLLSEGKAYRCICSKERLTELREQQTAAKQKPRYDGCCRDKNIGPDAGPFVIRFKTPPTGQIVIPDVVKGDITIANTELDDLIIARTDGSPTYNLTVVVDDWDMGVTHVLRGDDHINNTPRQIHILQALGAEVPIYGHMPMLLGEDGKRYSKRHGAVSVLQYRDDGYLPEALINYLVRLGWSHGDQEIFSIKEMIEAFNIKDINKSPGQVNKDKLDWLNQHYLKTLDSEDVAFRLAPYLKEIGGVFTKETPPLEEVVQIQKERCKTLVEMAEKSLFLYQENIVFDENAKNKFLKPNAIPQLECLLLKLTNCKEWNIENIHNCMHAVLEELEIKLGKLAQPLRVAVTGSTASPPINDTLYLLGREKTLQRLASCLDALKLQTES